MNAATPISKVVQLLSDLQAKISSEGAAAKKEYEEYSDWCEERSKNLGFEIKTGKDEVAELKATIGSKASLLASLDSMIDAIVETLKEEQKR